MYLDTDVKAGIEPDTTAAEKMSSGLVPLVFLVNLLVFGLLLAYSFLNLLPDLPAAHTVHPQTYVLGAVAMGVLAPAAASVIFLWPVFARLQRKTNGATGTRCEIPPAVVKRIASAPLALAAFTFIGWLCMSGFVAASATFGKLDVPLDHVAHFVSRPVLAGLIAATATFFAAEHFCRTRVWHSLLATTTIAGNRLLLRVQVWHRLVALWLVIGALPLSAVALTTLAQTNGIEPAADPDLGRFVNVLLLLTICATVGGAWLAWIVSLSITQPLATLEAATVRLSAGDFSTRVSVNATDEFGTLSEGFNLAAERLSQMYIQLEARNGELAQALDRVVFLENVKRGLDRFVPDAVRRAIEKNPETPALAKQAKDVTVLFLDIEGYSRLSEELTRPALNALVEHYFSLFLASIRAEGGDINETAGDGLMIIFQSRQASDHAAAAVRAALAIQRQTNIASCEATFADWPIVINIGISSGECDVGATRFTGPAGDRWTFTATGPVTNLAARLGDHANGGQILLASETAHRVSDLFHLRDMGLVTLKNISIPEQVWEIRVDSP